VSYDAFMVRNAASRLILAGLLTALSDGLFACVMTLTNNSTITRLWQGVAAVLLGRSSFNGGTRTALIGVLMHVAVAFTWSAIFLLLTMRSEWLRRVLQSRAGILKVAVIYGPFIWLVMSLAVIPSLVHRPPNLNVRWWIQLIGHAIFVGLPIVASIGSGVRRTSHPA
jgi:hypothetical protein